MDIFVISTSRVSHVYTFGVVRCLCIMRHIARESLYYRGNPSFTHNRVSRDALDVVGAANVFAISGADFRVRFGNGAAK